ncbi:hypothetical protein ACYF6T_13920 [Streptomyces sp. 7R007]
MSPATLWHVLVGPGLDATDIPPPGRLLSLRGLLRHCLDDGTGVPACGHLTPPSAPRRTVARPCRTAPHLPTPIPGAP